MKKGFTLIELMVVIGLLMMLGGAIGVGVSSAQKNARIAKANAEVRELTNAILSYENANKQNELPTLSGVEASEANLKFLMGNGETGNDNQKIAVLFNASLRGGKMYDPWGTPYKVLIKPGTATVKDNALSGISKITTFLPNQNRLTREERGLGGN